LSIQSKKIEEKKNLRKGEQNVEEHVKPERPYLQNKRRKAKIG